MNCLKRLSTITISILVASCATSGNSDRDYTNQRPQAVPVRAVSNFDEALRCMDEALLRSNTNRGQLLYAASLADPSGEVGAATNDMIAASALKMSERSLFFDVIEPTTTILNQSPLSFGAQYEVTGSITSYEKAVSGQQTSAGLSTGGDADLGFRTQRQNDIITVTLKIVNAERGTIIPGTISSSSLIVTNRSKGGNLTAQVESIGGFFELELERSEGVHQAVKALIDLAMIEAVGNMAKVPYYKCLSAVGTDPLAAAEARKEFDRLQPNGQLNSIADALVKLGYLPSNYYASEVDTQLRTAIADFQFERGLPPLGIPTFEVFYALRRDEFGLPASSQLERFELEANDPAIKIAPYLTPLTAAVDLNGDQYLAASIGTKLQFSVTVERDAYIACYYTDARNRTSLIYPKPEDQEQKIIPGRNVVIPGAGDPFSIVAGASFSNPATLPNTAIEVIQCFGSSKPFLTDVSDERLQTWLNDQPVTLGRSEIVTKVFSASEKTDSPIFSDTLAYVVYSPARANE